MSISRHAAYNAFGAAFPSILTLVTVPLYLEYVGLERYGVLTLCWVILGYSGFLDVGISMAVARRVALAGDNVEEANSFFWTAAWISILTGLVGACLIYFGSKLYFDLAAANTSSFEAELKGAIPLLAVTVPLLMLSGVFGGALQGREKFFTINAMVILGHSLMAIMPLLAAFIFGASLQVLVGGALAARLLPFPLGIWITKRAVPLRHPRLPSLKLVPELVGFGGWVSLTVVANTIINTIDRLLIGSRIGAAAVPAYAIPYSLVSRVIIIPHSLSSALLPRLAGVEDDERRQLTLSSIESVAVLITPAIIATIALTEPFFRLWIGAEMAQVSTPIGHVLASGFWFYCLGHIAYSTLQATGRPDLVSKVLLAELLPFGIALMVGISALGALGAAIVVTLRSVLDSFLFFRLAGIFRPAMTLLALPGSMVVAAALAAFLLPWLPSLVILVPLLAASTYWSIAHAPAFLEPWIARVRRPFFRLFGRAG